MTHFLTHFWDPILDPPEGSWRVPQCAFHGIGLTGSHFWHDFAYPEGPERDPSGGAQKWVQKWVKNGSKNGSKMSFWRYIPSKNAIFGQNRHFGPKIAILGHFGPKIGIFGSLGDPSEGPPGHGCSEDSQDSIVIPQLSLCMYINNTLWYHL